MSSAFADTAQAPTVDPHSVPSPEQHVRPIWPQAVVVFGLGLTAGWAMLLGYGFVRLIALVF